MNTHAVKTNVIDINNNLNFLKGNLKDLIIVKDNLEKNKYSDLSDKTIYLSLQPVIDYNHEIIYYNIVARTHNNEEFPIEWYQELSKDDRIEYIIKCITLKNYLDKHNIYSRFTIEECDFISIKRKINISNYELSIYGQNLNGKISYNGAECKGGPLHPLNNEQPILDNYHQLDTDYYDMYYDSNNNLQYCKTLLDRHKECGIDNCFSINNKGIYDDNRCYKRIIQLIKDQSEIICDNLCNKPVKIIKIDETIAKRAFIHGQYENVYSQELSKAVDTIWSIDPKIIFVIKYYIPKDNYIRVKSIYRAIQNNKYDKVLIQGALVKDYAFRVTIDHIHNIKIEK